MGSSRSFPKREPIEPGARSSLLPMACIVVASLTVGLAACKPAAPSTQDISLEQTRAALDAEATALALESQQLTEQAGAQPPIVATEAPPPTEGLPPTATPTAMPLYPEGSMQRASYDPAASWGEPDTSEDFDDEDGIVKARTGAAASSWYGDGRFHITFTTMGWWTWYYADIQSSDFYADVVIINGDQCVDRDSAGLVVRGEYAADVGFLFGITCGGGYYIGVSGGIGPGGPVCTFTGHAVSFPLEANEWDCSGFPVVRESEYVDPGPGGVNRLGVQASGNEYEVYINGHLVETFADNFTAGVGTPVTSGWYALFLGTGQKEKAAVSFDDFSVWRYP